MLWRSAAFTINMRANAPQFALLALLLTGPAVYSPAATVEPHRDLHRATPLHPPVRTAEAATAKRDRSVPSRAPERRTASSKLAKRDLDRRERGRPDAKLSTLQLRKAGAEPRRSARHAGLAEREEARHSFVATARSKSAPRLKPESRLVAKLEPRAELPSRRYDWQSGREPQRLAAPSEAAHTAEPEIHVTHDRKVHYSAEIGAQTDAAAKDPAQAREAIDSPSPLESAPTPEPLTGVSHPPSDDVVKADTDPVEHPASENLATAGRPAVVTPPASPAPSGTAGIRPTPARPQLPAVAEIAVTPNVVPTLYNKRGRLVVPPPLKGSHEILLHQNVVADREGLDRIQDDVDLAHMREAHILVAIPVSDALVTDARLPGNRRYVRPWTAQFLSAMARAHYARFHSPLQVNSAVRTVTFQQHLIQVNGNAAPADGDTASPHLTGQAVDVAKRGLSMTEIAWMRGYLLPLVQQGKVDVEEEFLQSCFHISVYKSYLPAPPSHRTLPRRRGPATALATVLP